MRGVYRLPRELRGKLAKPLGHVFTPEEIADSEFERLMRGATMVVTVGDRVTETLGGLGRTPEVQVVDGVERRIRRDPPDVPYSRLIKVRNPAGTITQEAIEGVRKAIEGRKPVRVLVDGEEDLMAMLAIAMAPISAVVFYGQPGVGIVSVKVSALSKSRSRTLLGKMGIRSVR